jgi:chromosome partitioning protein
MKTILITSQKGGSGKTTLAAHLAVEAERQGDSPACIVDTDKQATLSQWHSRREEDTPARMDVPLMRLATGLQTLATQKTCYCFIDSAPTISEQTTALIALSDLVLIPVRPSPADLWSVAETVALVKAAGKPLLFVVTQAKPQATITAQAVAALSQHGRVAQSFIADRVPYAAAMTGGRTAQEINPRSPAALELTALWKDIKTCFHENMKT